MKWKKNQGHTWLIQFIALGQWRSGTAGEHWMALDGIGPAILTLYLDLKTSNFDKILDFMLLIFWVYLSYLIKLNYWVYLFKLLIPKVYVEVSILVTGLAQNWSCGIDKIGPWYNQFLCYEYMWNQPTVCAPFVTTPCVTSCNTSLNLLISHFQTPAGINPFCYYPVCNNPPC